MSGGGDQNSSRSSSNPVIHDSFDDNEEAATAPTKSHEMAVIDDDSDELLGFLTTGDDAMEIDDEKPLVAHSILEDSFDKSFELVPIRNKGGIHHMEESSQRSTPDGSGMRSPLSETITEEGEHATTLVSVLGNVVQHHLYTANDVNSVVDCFTESGDASTLGDILALGMAKLMMDANANPRAKTAIFRFVSMVSLRSLKSDCMVPFSTIHEVIDTFIERPEGYCRIRSCQLIATMLAIGEEMDDTDVDDGKGLPTVPILQWCNHLSVRHLDKDVGVRCASLQAFSRLQIEKFFDNKGRRTTPHQMIASSLNDFSPEVRKTAIQLLTLVSRDAISTAIRFLRDDEETPSLRVLMAERIISEVHVRSFSEKQRVELLSLLYNDKDVAVRGLLGTRLVGCWLKGLAEEEEAGKEGEKRLPAHPMALLKQLNCFKDEELVAVVVKLALSHFMEAAVETRTDGTAYVDFLRTIPKELRESSGTLHKKSVIQEIRADKAELPQKLFMHRCLLEFFNSLYPLPADLGKRDYILSRHLPNALEICSLFKHYAIKIFDPAKACSKNQLFVFRQIGHLIRTLDLDCPIAKKAYEETLKELISDKSVMVPMDIIEFAMDELWIVIVRDDDPEDFVEWAGFVMGTMLDSIPILRTPATDHMDMREYSPAEYADFIRVATIMECVLRNPAVTTLHTLLRSAFTRIVDPIKTAVTEHDRSLGIRITGLVLRLDKSGSFVYANAVTFRHSMLYDSVEVKVHAFRALVDIMWEYGFDIVALSAFPEIKDKLKYREELAALPEQLVTGVPPSNHLSEIVFIACRLIYKCVWPKLIGAILFRLFDAECDAETHHVAQVFFTGFVEKGVCPKIEMIAGFMACCKFVEEEFDMGHKFRFGCMMTFVSELFEKSPDVQESTLPNKITIYAVFAINLLRKIAADPRGSIQPQLACCLGSIKVDAIHGKDAKKVLQTATNVLRRLYNDSALGKMKIAVSRFRKAVERQVELTADGPRQNPKRRAAVKKEELDEYSEMEDGDDEMYSPCISKRLRLCRSNSQGVWSRSDESVVKVDAVVKDEQMSQTSVKQEPLDPYYDEPEGIVIDSDEEDDKDDLKVLSHIVPMRRRIQRSVLEEEDDCDKD